MATEPEPGGGGNLLTRKYGPLPLWAYGGLAAAVAYLYIRHQSNASGGAAAVDSTATDEADSIASDTAADLEQDTGSTDLPAPPDVTNVPAPPDVTSTPPKKKKPTGGPKGNTSGKLRVISVASDDDTVAKLLKKYGITLGQLRKDNPGRQWTATEKLKPGEKIHIPAGG